MFSAFKVWIGSYFPETVYQIFNRDFQRSLPCTWTTQGVFALMRIQTTCTWGSCSESCSVPSTTHTTTSLTGPFWSRRPRRRSQASTALETRRWGQPKRRDTQRVGTWVGIECHVWTVLRIFILRSVFLGCANIQVRMLRWLFWKVGVCSQHHFVSSALWVNKCL